MDRAIIITKNHKRGNRYYLKGTRLVGIMPWFRDELISAGVAKFEDEKKEKPIEVHTREINK